MTRLEMIAPKPRRLNWVNEILPLIKKRLDYLKRRKIESGLRGMHYHLFSVVTEGRYPNTTSKYGYLSKYTGEFRKDGKLPIDCFIDDTRAAINDNLYSNPNVSLESLMEYVEGFPERYRKGIPYFRAQHYYKEIWAEKNSIAKTLKSIIGDKYIPIVPSRGYSSIPFFDYNMERLKYYHKTGYKVQILYFGDLDPTGVVIQRNILDTLRRYNLHKVVEFKRLAITVEQIERYNLPTDPDAKTEEKLMRDMNTKFIKEYGRVYQVEVEALESKATDDFIKLVLDSINEGYDQDVRDAVLNEEIHTEVNLKESLKDQLTSLLDRL